MQEVRISCLLKLDKLSHKKSIHFLWTNLLLLISVSMNIKVTVNREEQVFCTPKMSEIPLMGNSIITIFIFLGD
jgi:hypothetical protein